MGTARHVGAEHWRQLLAQDTRRSPPPRLQEREGAPGRAQPSQPAAGCRQVSPAGQCAGLVVPGESACVNLGTSPTGAGPCPYLLLRLFAEPAQRGSGTKSGCEGGRRPELLSPPRSCTARAGAAEGLPRGSTTGSPARAGTATCCRGASRPWVTPHPKPASPRGICLCNLPQHPPTGTWVPGDPAPREPRAGCSCIRADSAGRSLAGRHVPPP